MDQFGSNDFSVDWKQLRPNAFDDSEKLISLKLGTPSKTLLYESKDFMIKLLIYIHSRTDKSETQP